MVAFTFDSHSFADSQAISFVQEATASPFSFSILTVPLSSRFFAHESTPYPLNFVSSLLVCTRYSFFVDWLIISATALASIS